jgi:hypothetical protein
VTSVKYQRLNSGPLRQVAEAFNSYFLSAVDKLIGHSSNGACYLPLSRECSAAKISDFVNIPVTEAEVLSTINSFKNKTSCGYDGVSNKVVKLCGQQIVKPLTHIYNLSVSSGIYPDRLNYANVIPCFKTGDETGVANYRPISLLIGFARLLEMLVFSRLKQHVARNDILAPE